MPCNRPVILCILDGWGHREYDDNNGLSVAHHWKKILKTYPHTFLSASEGDVGLPKNQFGNSEVGHMTIGLGRVIPQDLPMIQSVIETKSFSQLPDFQELIQKTKAGSNRCHLIGLLSNGGVHSHEDHFIHAIDCLTDAGVNVILHPILDGRDTAPKAAMQSLQKLKDHQKSNVYMGTIGGRYYYMDRDHRWQRIKMATDAMAISKSPQGAPSSFMDALEISYADEITDEFMKPIAIKGYEGIKNGDTLFMINFRADRVKQIMCALLDPSFQEYLRIHPDFGYALSMVEYASEFSHYLHPLFKKSSLMDGLGEVISKKGLKQLRVAETEKYAHVTYFFNGGREEVFDGEDRILIPSPSVSTYDLMPEMSASQVTEAIINAIKSHYYDLIVVNYANADMVGHTGKPLAIRQAISCLDSNIASLVDVVIEENAVLVLTADHGNAETMISENGDPHTAHTLNKVPFVVVNYNKNMKLMEGEYSLKDIAPTILDILNLEKPSVMTGNSIKFAI